MTFVNHQVAYQVNYNYDQSPPPLVFPIIDNPAVPTLAQLDAAVVAFVEEMEIQHSGSVASVVRTITADDRDGEFWTPPTP